MALPDCSFAAAITCWTKVAVPAITT
jgi:hypothetical protein